MSPFPLRRSHATFLALALVAGSAASVAAAPAGTSPAPSPAPSESLVPRKGDVIKPFSAVGMDGVARQVDFAKGGPTILLFFLSSCPACHKMLPEWNSAYSKRATGVTVYGIVMDQPPPSFFVVTPVAFPVLRSPGREFTQLLGVQRVPTTVRVAPGGKVEDAVLGHIDPIRLGELFRR
jgi:hypothetical protein